VLAPFVAERFGQLSDGAFGGGVGGDGEAALEGEEGAEVDDFAATEGDHVLTGRLAQQPHRCQVDIQNLTKTNS
jgi:hypothetical protein